MIKMIKTRIYINKYKNKILFIKIKLIYKIKIKYKNIKSM